MENSEIIFMDGFMKSEFTYKANYAEVFDKNHLQIGRMLSGSKSGYRDKYPDNLVVFNANIVLHEIGKIWYGDIDVTRDFENLKNIADELKCDLYIIREMDARFENENAGMKYWAKAAVAVIKTSAYDYLKTK
jgi:hypothetical protein